MASSHQPAGRTRPRRSRVLGEPCAPHLSTSGLAVVCWYATVGYHPDDVKERRELASWFRDKAQPSVLDILAKLRRVIVAGYLRSEDAQPPTPQEITILGPTWKDVAA